MGELGTKVESPVTIVWKPVGLLFGAIPWVVVMAMFMAKPNRCPRAWRLWIPLVLVVILMMLLRSLLAVWNQTGADMLHRVFVSLAFGVCFIWLLAPYLAPLPRPVRFFCYLFLIIIAAVVHGLDLGLVQEMFPYLVMAGAGAVCIALAIGLSARCCRRRYTVRRFGGWALLWVTVPWLAVFAAMMLPMMAVGANGPPVGEFMLVALGLGAATFLALMPFLVLSRYEPFYAERLRALVEPSELPAAPALDGGSSPEPATSPGP